MSDEDNNSKKSGKVFIFVLCAFLISIAIIFSANQIKMAYVVNDNVSVSIVSPLESNGAVPINVQDQHSPAFDIFFTLGLIRKDHLVYLSACIPNISTYFVLAGGETILCLGEGSS